MISNKISANNTMADPEELNRRVIQQALDLVESQRRLNHEVEKRKEISVAFDELSRRHELILQSAGEGIYGLDLDGNTTFINPSAAKMIGYDPKELIGKQLHNILHHTKPDGTPYPEEECSVDATLKEGIVHHITDEVFWRKDGSSFPVEYISTPIIENGRILGAVVTFNDITEHKNLEKKLWNNEQRYRTISESSPVGIFQIDGDDFYIYFNTRWQMITKRTMKDSLGHKWWEIIHPDDREFIFGRWAECEQGKESLSLECRIQRPDGEVVWCQVNVNFFNHDYGKTTIGTIEDISIRRQIQSQLERSNEALNDFASIASHDLQEPLRKIISFGDQIEKIIPLNEDRGRDYLKRMQNAALRMQIFIHDLLQFARVSAQSKPFEPVDLHNLLNGVLDDLEVRISESRGTVHVEKLPTVIADSLQIHQLFQNLIGNALKFYRKDVPPVINVTSSKLDGNKWEIRIEDNGIGFDEKYLNRIFKPFERLQGRSTYEGSGIGLAICQKIVARHRGTITATSKPQEGSTFVITLPEK